MNVDLSKLSDEEIMAQESSNAPEVSKPSKQPTKKKDTSKTKGWVKKPKLEELKHDLEQAKSSHSTFISNLDNWQKLYDAEKRPQGKDNSSRIQPKLIRKQVEWRAPALSEPFLSTSNLYDVKPLTYEDVARAEQNSLVLNRQFNTQLNKVKFVDEVIRKVVKEGTAIARTGWEFHEEEVLERIPQFEYTQVEDPQEQEQLLAEYQELMQLMETAPDSYEQLPEAKKAGFEMSMEQQGAFTAEEVGVTEEPTMKTIVNRPTVEVCNARNVYIDPTCKGDINNAEFVIYSFETSLAALKKDPNYINLDKLSSADHSGSALEHDSNTEIKGFKFADTARKKLVVYEYWGYWDIDDNNTTKPIIVSWVGDQIIRMEDNPFPDGKPPFIIFNYLPEEDSVYGIPDAELLGDNQEILGAVTRGVIDIMGKSANAQTGYAKNFLDVSNQLKFRRGEDYMFNPGFDHRIHMHTHTFKEIPNSALQVIQMVNNEAESMSGIKAFGQDGLSAVNFGNTSVGVRGVLDAVSKREMSVLRRISDGFIQLGRKIIAMNAEFLSEEEVIRVTNKQFVTIRRDDLAGDYDVTLTISTAEADDAKAQELAFILQTVGDTMGPEIKQIVLADIARLRKMPDLAEKLENYAPEPDEMQQKMQELEIAKMEAEVALMQAEAAETQAKAAVYQAKVAVEEARAQDLQGSASNKALDFEERDSGKRFQQDIQKQDAQVEGNLAMQHAKAQAQREQMGMGMQKDVMGKAVDAQLDPQMSNSSLAGSQLGMVEEPELPTEPTPLAS